MPVFHALSLLLLPFLPCEAVEAALTLQHNIWIILSML
ncbi:hypothetical protein BN132_470 [Cronobacter turicensis 564]|nr:hypothetical protein BN132_470 [Cronobacter turicensis 564]